MSTERSRHRAAMADRRGQPTGRRLLGCPARRKRGHIKFEVMPTDACQFFYECERCKAVLRRSPETVGLLSVRQLPETHTGKRSVIRFNP